MIKEKIFLRGICETARKSFRSSPLARGIYCNARLKLNNSAALVIVALDKRGGFDSEMLLNSDYKDLEDRLRDAAVDFAKRAGALRLIIAMKKTDEDTKEQFRYRAAFAVVMGKILKNEGLSLEEFYLTDTESFDFQDLSP